MTDFLTLYQEVQGNIARQSTADDFAITIAKRGINAGMMAASLMFEPPEIHTAEDLTALTTQDYVSTTTMTRLQRVEEVYNATSGKRVWPLPFNLRNTLWLPSSGNIQFYSMYGVLMYYNPTPDAETTLNVYFLQYPELLEDDDDTFPFPTLEAFVLSMATEYAWAALEETDSQALWAKLSDKYSLPEGMAAKIRLMLQEQYKVEEVKSG